MSTKSTPPPPSTGGAPANKGADIVQDLISSLKPTFDNVVAQIQAESNVVLTRVKETTPADHAVTFSLCFLVLAFFQFIGRDENEGIVTLGVLFSTVLFGVLLAAVHGLNWFHQYSSSLVFFSVLDFLGIFDSSPLFLSFFPVLVEKLRKKVLEVAKQAKN